MTTMCMKHYNDIFLDFDDTLYDTHGNSIIALRKLYDIRHWERIMPSYEAFRDAYFATNVEVWKAYAHGVMDRDTLIVERYRRPVTEMVKKCGGDTSWITPEWCVAVVCSDISTDHVDSQRLLMWQVDGIVEVK